MSLLQKFYIINFIYSYIYICKKHTKTCIFLSCVIILILLHLILLYDILSVTRLIIILTIVYYVNSSMILITAAPYSGRNPKDYPNVIKIVSIILFYYICCI